MRNFLLLLLLSSLLACEANGMGRPLPQPSPTSRPSPKPSASPLPSDTPYIGPIDFKPFVNKFVADGLIQGIKVPMNNLTMQFGDLSRYGSGVIGLCELSSSYRRITASPAFWNKADNTQRELLIHHELGHCSLSRAHRQDVFDDGTPESIMYPIIMRNSVYSDNYAYYQNELYTYKDGLENLDSVRVFICPGN